MNHSREVIISDSMHIVDHNALEYSIVVAIYDEIESENIHLLLPESDVFSIVGDGILCAKLSRLDENGFYTKIRFPRNTEQRLRLKYPEFFI
jgi:hypothetical protein